MLDRLRESAMKDEFDDFDPDAMAVSREAVDEGRIFGLSAVERMFLSVLLFLTVSVLGVLLLVAMDKINLG